MNAVIRLRPESESRMPSAKDAPIAAFVRDEISKTAVTTALGQAGPSAIVKLGGIDEAIAHIAQDPSARTILVDLSGGGEPLVALDQLAEVCMPGTRVIAIGEVNDIHFYRLLRSTGVAEYLVKPVTAETFRSAIEAAGQDRNPVAVTPPEPAGAVGNDLIAVVGARGGVGTTMVAVSLAWLFAGRSQTRTVLVDLDLHSGSTGLALDIEPGRGLSEALASPDRIDGLLISSATAKLNDHLYLLSSEQPLDSVRPSPADAVARLVQGLRQGGFQRIVLDVPRSDAILLPQGLEQATSIVLVTDFSLAGVRDTRRLVALAERVAPMAKRYVVGNRQGAAKKGELPRREIEKALGVPLACVISEDGAAVLQALNAGKPVPAGAPNSPVTATLRSLVQTLTDATAAPARRGPLAKFFLSPPKKPKS